MSKTTTHSCCLDLVTFRQADGSLEEYFFVVEQAKRSQDVGSLLHIVGSGTAELYLHVTNNFCPSRQATFVRRQYLGIVPSVAAFINVVNAAPLCVTKENTKINRAIYHRWKKDMIREATNTGVLIE